ncbi:MAG: hypothetical protein D8M58_21055 [Calditrichaeota bacterium]|nr:MAG: hypothetical protein DWQ03_16770 [Calditrichota bacterium]MBL1207901.1 hypothetical protein [Calditrichota bacterium]NOG47736.1 hypothetical protein [Calditrichota bacterium]
MFTENLNIEEKQIIVETLEMFLSDLRMEISHTDKKEFRDELKHRKTVIAKTIHLLKDQQPLNYH